MEDQMSPPTGRHPRHRSLTRGAQTLMLGVIAAIGFCAFAAAPALALPQTGTITGTFTVPAGIAPSNISVFLLSPGSNSEGAATVTTVNPTTGSYSFTGVKPGQYYVYFEDTAGTTDNVQYDYYGDGGTDTIQAASLATVTAGNTTPLGSTALHAGGTLSGTVTDANRSVETEEYVYIYPIVTGVQPDPEIDSYDGIPEQVSLTTGAWSVSGLPPGNYEIAYDADGVESGNSLSLSTYVANGTVSYDYGSSGTYSVSTGATTTVNFSVPALGIVSGTVSGPKGPLFDDEVYTYDNTGGYGPGTSTASNGTYWFALLPGTYKVQVESIPASNLAEAWYGGATQASAAGVSATAGGTTPNINITLGAGGAISGTVAAAQGGAPVGDLEVEVVDAQGNFIEDGYSLANGTYTVGDLPAGTWYVEFWGGEASNGSFYSTGFYGGKLSEAGSTPVTISAGQTVANVNGVLLPAAAGALGLPSESAAGLSGLHNNKVALKFNVAAGSGAGYLKSLTIALPKGFSWNSGKLAADLSLGAGVTYTDQIAGGKLTIMLNSGAPNVAFSLKAGGITVTKAIEKAAGGSTAKKKTKKKKKHHLAMAAKAKKKKKPAKGKDTIKSETINLSVADTTGLGTSLPITIKKPH
jgi:hypothetical protein